MTFNILFEMTSSLNLFCPSPALKIFFPYGVPKGLKPHLFCYMFFYNFINNNNKNFTWERMRNPHTVYVTSFQPKIIKEKGIFLDTFEVDAHKKPET